MASKLFCPSQATLATMRGQPNISPAKRSAIAAASANTTNHNRPTNSTPKSNPMISPRKNAGTHIAATATSGIPTAPMAAADFSNENSNASSRLIGSLRVNFNSDTRQIATPIKDQINSVLTQPVSKYKNALKDHRLVVSVAPASITWYCGIENKCVKGSTICVNTIRGPLNRAPKMLIELASSSVAKNTRLCGLRLYWMISDIR